MRNYDYIMNLLTPQKLAEILNEREWAVEIGRPRFSYIVQTAFCKWLNRTGDGFHKGNRYIEGDKIMPDPRYWQVAHDDEYNPIQYGSGKIVGMQMFLDAEYNAEDWGE